MDKAFLFDMDGVLVNSEGAWEGLEYPMLEQVVGKEVADKIGDTVGLGVDGVYKRALAAGSKVSRHALIAGYEKTAVEVYARAPLTQGTDALVRKLRSLGYHLGMVTQSPQSWIDKVLPRLSFRDEIEVVISLFERTDLSPKPAPDGYLTALASLNASPELSFVLEDSNLGIVAAKAAKCFVIGYRGNLVEGYEQEGADTYADTMEEVGAIVATRP